MNTAPLTYFSLYLKTHFLQILHAPSLPGTRWANKEKPTEAKPQITKGLIRRICPQPMLTFCNRDITFKSAMTTLRCHVTNVKKVRLIFRTDGVFDLLRLCWSGLMHGLYAPIRKQSQTCWGFSSRSVSFSPHGDSSMTKLNILHSSPANGLERLTQLVHPRFRSHFIV